jgi:hypothetical protein
VANSSWNIYWNHVTHLIVFPESYPAVRANTTISMGGRITAGSSSTAAAEIVAILASDVPSPNLGLPIPAIAPRRSAAVSAVRGIADRASTEMAMTAGKERQIGASTATAASTEMVGPG